MVVLKDKDSGLPYVLTIENGVLYIVETAFVPVIIGADLAPNPAVTGQRVMISVAAEDTASVPAALRHSGQLVCGEVQRVAITTVRARLGETWTALEYNPATGRWEGVLLPGRTSAHQPGGYYGVEVEAANDRGETASISGEALAALRLVVRETQKLLLNLVSPAAGYVTVKRPEVVMDAVDEAGGSGIALDSWAVLLDGAVQSAGKAAEEIPGGYRLRWTPQADLGEGRHIVTFTVSDRDGNEAGEAAAYTVDTVPPALAAFLPDSRRVVDQAEVTVRGTARDGTSGISGVAVVGEGGPAGVEIAPAGEFVCTVPLEVGVNTITVTARDSAGWTAVQTFTVIRIVTDRTPADAERVRELCTRGYDRWTAEERA